MYRVGVVRRGLLGFFAEGVILGGVWRCFGAWGCGGLWGCGVEEEREGRGGGGGGEVGGHGKDLALSLGFGVLVKLTRLRRMV